MIIRTDDVTAEDVRAVLADAATIIETQGWWRSTYAGLSTYRSDPNGDCKCLVTAVKEATRRRWDGFQQSDEDRRETVRYRATLALRAQLGLPYITDVDHIAIAVMRANDSQPVETGPQWAIDTLRGAVAYVV